MLSGLRLPRKLYQTAWNQALFGLTLPLRLPPSSQTQLQALGATTPINEAPLSPEPQSPEQTPDASATPLTATKLTLHQLTDAAPDQHANIVLQALRGPDSASLKIVEIILSLEKDTQQEVLTQMPNRYQWFIRQEDLLLTLPADLHDIIFECYWQQTQLLFGQDWGKFITQLAETTTSGTATQTPAVRRFLGDSDSPLKSVAEEDGQEEQKEASHSTPERTVNPRTGYGRLTQAILDFLAEGPKDTFIALTTQQLRDLLSLFPEACRLDQLTLIEPYITLKEVTINDLKDLLTRHNALFPIAHLIAAFVALKPMLDNTINPELTDAAPFWKNINRALRHFYAMPTEQRTEYVARINRHKVTRGSQGHWKYALHKACLGNYLHKPTSFLNQEWPNEFSLIRQSLTQPTSPLKNLETLKVLNGQFAIWVGYSAEYLTRVMLKFLDKVVLANSESAALGLPFAISQQKPASKRQRIRSDSFDDTASVSSSASIVSSWSVASSTGAPEQTLQQWQQRT